MRYHVQALPSGKWITRDLPLAGAEIIRDLSGPSGISGRVPRGFAGPVTESITQWGAAIYPEDGGQLRGGYIVTSTPPTPSELLISGVGFAGYPHGMTWTGNYASPVPGGVDPADALRKIWAHLQAQRNGDLGVTVAGSTPVVLGQFFLHRWNGKKWIKLSAPASMLADLFRATPQDGRVTAFWSSGGWTDKGDPPPSASYGDRWYDGLTQWIYHGKWRGHESNSDVIDTAFTRYSGLRPRGANKTSTLRFSDSPTDGKEAGDLWLEDGRYQLRWWDHPDCGQEIDRLATETPFDYRERHAWNGENVDHVIEIGYPQLGRRRHDLRFVLDENLATPPLPITSEDYANEIIGLGAGEGRKMLRATAGRPDGRLRRTSLLTEKDVRTRRRLSADTARELDRVQGLLLPGVEIIEHPNAPIAAIDPGDDIRVQADLGWQQFDQWCRVVSIRHRPEQGTARLELEPV